MNTNATPHYSAREIGTDEAAGTGQHEWVAQDGTTVVLRPIKPSDFELERDFVNGLSRYTGYQRLMSGRQPSVDELQRWTNIHWEREGAVIATVSVGGHEAQIGVARYTTEPGKDEAEFAIVISDAWHGKGLGTHLLTSLIDLARRSGVKRLFGTTLTENVGMLALARHLGFKLSRQAGAAAITMMSLALLPQDGEPSGGGYAKRSATSRRGEV